MTDRSEPRPRRSSPPLWLVEGLDIAQQRRSMLLSVVAGTVVLGLVLTITAPGLVPPVPLVGAAVGFAALLLGLAAAVALDATDLRLRGPRHVGAAGGELVAVLPVQASVEAAVPLATAVLDAREDDAPLLLGLAAAGRDAQHTAAWTDALGRALVGEDVSVLCIDLASGRSEAPGLVEVVRDGVKLSQAVRFEPGARLARIGAGGDHAGALTSLATLPSRLPRDLDVLLVALPTAASRQVVEAVRSLDHVLIVAERDHTSRVDLIAGLDALDSVGTRAQVALLDDPTASRMAPRPPAAVDTAEARDGDEDASDDDPDDQDDPDGSTAADDRTRSDAGPRAGADAEHRPTEVGRASESGGGTEPRLLDPQVGEPTSGAADRLATGGSATDRPGTADATTTGPGTDEPAADGTATDGTATDGTATDGTDETGPRDAADRPSTTSPAAKAPASGLSGVLGAGAAAIAAAYSEATRSNRSVDPAAAGGADAADDRETPHVEGTAHRATGSDDASSPEDPASPAEPTAPPIDEDDGDPTVAMPAIGSPAPVDRQPPAVSPADAPREGGEVRRREVEVLLGAAEAAAIAMAAADQREAPEVGDEQGPRAPLSQAPAVPETPSTVELGDASSRRVSEEPSERASSGLAPGEGTDRTRDDTGQTGEPTPGHTGETTAPDATTPTRPSTPESSSEGERTDELPRADTGLRGADDQQEEMLHTTARLSILLEDLEQRPDEGGDGRA